MKAISKLTAIMLTLILALGFVVPVYADTTETAGKLDGNISYSYNKGTGTLTITGTGEYYDNDGNYPWKDFTNVKKVIIGEGITSVGVRSFNRMTELRIIELPSTIKSIEKYALYGTAVNELNIPDGVEAIGEGACENMKELKKLTLPESLKQVDEDAFHNCDSLKEIYIPKSLTKIGEGAFTGLDNAQKIIVNADNPAYDSRGNCNAIIETETNAMIAACALTEIPKTVTIIAAAYEELNSITEMTLPDNITEVRERSFWNCDKLTKFDFGKGVVKVGKEAFYSCSKLESVVFHDAATELDSMIFWECKNLTSVKLSSKIDYLPFGIFAGCYKMTEFKIPSNIVKLEQCALQSTGIEELVIPKTVQIIGKQVIQNSPNLKKLTVEEGNPMYDSRDNCNAIIETKTNTPHCDKGRQGWQRKERFC